MLYKRRQCAAHERSRDYKDYESHHELHRLEPSLVSCIAGNGGERKIYISRYGEYPRRQQAVNAEDYLYRRIDPEREPVVIDHPAEYDGTKGEASHEGAEHSGYGELSGAERQYEKPYPNELIRESCQAGYEENA